jgi:hypothetical protein
MPELPEVETVVRSIQSLVGRRISSAADAAREYVTRNRQQFGLTGSDTGDMTISSTVFSAHNGVTHVYLQQRYRGIEVWNAILNVSVRSDGSVLASGSRFVSNIASAVGGQQPRRAAELAAGDAARHLRLQPTRPFQVVARTGGLAEAVTISDGGIAEKPIEGRLVWLPIENAVRLAWDLRIDEVGGQHWWHAFVDAENGASLGQLDLIVHDPLDATAGVIARPESALASLPAFPPTDGARYNVFPLPFESPSDGDRVLVSNVADPRASPFGWHDTNGVPGAEFFITRGNNVHAYTDLNADNVADPGSSPDGGGTLTFDFALDLTQNAATYRPAAVTNLFYWNNVMHDVSYNYGFDEASGNFQVNTYGKGGLGNDDVRAEAQDGSGTNNANFGTGVDGTRPRMQMFIWTHPRPNTVTVSGGPAAGNYVAARATFGPQLNATGVSGSVVLVNDGVIGPAVPPAAAGTLTDGCEPFGGVAGKIALVDRGFCNFTAKVANAQNAGALAVIVVNNVAGNPTTMGFTAPIPPIVIPSVMVSLDDGNLFKANVPLNATLKLDPARGLTRDSDLDAGVIAHEYTHGISNRLTGGPATASCLNNAEQMGEGWSDFVAISLTTRPSDTSTTPRGVGTYVGFEPADGDGIRPTPYTTDMTVNPATYAAVADTANISQPHGIGYVWSSMLWEMYWNLVDRYGYNSNLYGHWSTGGNNLALQLVLDGMKFQICRPGFVDGRNAILQADAALTGGANACEIWRAFAKRGLGFSASQGLSSSRSDGVEAFDLPASCTAATFAGFHPPVEAAPAMNVVNAGSVVPLKFTLTAGDSPLIDSQPVDCTTLAPTGAAPSPLDSPGGTDLTQNGLEFHINWKTSPVWAGSCRRVTLRVPAASDPVAYFRFE